MICSCLWLAAGVGTLSALIPIVNAEVYLLAAIAIAASAHEGWAIVAALTVGQILGKIVIFYLARWGKSIGERTWSSLRRPPKVRTRESRWSHSPVVQRVQAWSKRGLAMMDNPLGAAGILLVSASFGIPPLAITTAVAGAQRTPLWIFVVCTTAGRLIRFGAMAAPILFARF